MAMLVLSRKILYNNQLRRQLHKSAVVFSTPYDTLFKDKKALQDVKPAIINSILTSPKLTELPEVRSWVKNIDCNCNTYIPKDNALFQDKEAFDDVMADVIHSFLTNSKLTKLPEVRNWVKKLLDYTVEGGKRGRAYCIVFAYRMFEKPENITEAALHTARVLGCCLEMGFFLGVDDIIDGSTTRRGKVCWYLQPNIGSAAINDYIFIHQSIMEVLQQRFRNTPLYADVIKYFNEAVQHITISQYLESSSLYNKQKNNIDGFTMERYDFMCHYKASYYSFNIPIMLALLFVKNGSEKQIEKCNSIFFELGKLIQLQNDYKDVYIDETITGKAGTDIQEGKLTWLAVKALERCNETQRFIFKEYYGSKDPEHVKRIKQLYDELQIPQVYEQYDSTIQDDIIRLIQALPTDGEKKLCIELLNASYGIDKQSY